MSLELSRRNENQLPWVGGLSIRTTHPSVMMPEMGQALPNLACLRTRKSGSGTSSGVSKGPCHPVTGHPGLLTSQYHLVPKGPLTKSQSKYLRSSRR